MSGCGFTTYKPKFKFQKYHEYTDRLEKANNSNNRLYQLVADYINEKNGITTCSKGFVFSNHKSNR